MFNYYNSRKCTCAAGQLPNFGYQIRYNLAKLWVKTKCEGFYLGQNAVYPCCCGIINQAKT